MEISTELMEISIDKTLISHVRDFTAGHFISDLSGVDNHTNNRNKTHISLNWALLKLKH